MSNQRATDRVLNSPELLILIFSHMSPPDLFFSVQHTNRTWHQIIYHTRQLQDLIFYRNIPFSCYGDMRLNPILVQALPMFFQSKRWVDVFSFGTMRPEAIAESAASFREMPVFVGGFEMSEVAVFKETVDIGFRQRRGVVRLPAGESVLKMGTLVDTTLAWCASDPQASFVIRWGKTLLDKKVSVQQPEPIQWKPESAESGGLWSRFTRGFTRLSGGRNTNRTMPSPSPSGPIMPSYLEYPILAGPIVVQIVLFKISLGVRLLTTDIVDVDKPDVMPEQWRGKEEIFGRLHIKFANEGYNVVHLTRMLNGTLKYRSEDEAP